MLSRSVQVLEIFTVLSLFSKQFEIKPGRLFWIVEDNIKMHGHKWQTLLFWLLQATGSMCWLMESKEGLNVKTNKGRNAAPGHCLSSLFLSFSPSLRAVSHLVTGISWLHLNFFPLKRESQLKFKQSLEMPALAHGSSTHSCGQENITPSALSLWKELPGKRSCQ